MRNATVRIAALLAVLPSLTAAAPAEEPTDDLYFYACDTAQSDTPPCDAEKCDAEPCEAVKCEPAQCETATCQAACGKAGPVVAATTVVAQDDLFVELTAPLSAPGAENAAIVQVAETIEMVPAPDTFQPLRAPQQLTPAATSSAGMTGLNKPIVSLTLDAAADPQLVANLSRLKAEVAIQDESLTQFGSWDSPTGEASMTPARFAPRLVSWAAPAVYTNPLYFEQPNVERYGHYAAVCENDNATQSAVSAAHFFVSIPALPYKIGAACPSECNYVLGSYRPGSCNPHQLLRPEWSLRGLLFEGMTATGLVFLLP